MALFNNLSIQSKIQQVKHDFLQFVKSIFENPTILKSYIDQNKLSNDQSKVIISKLNILNSKSCGCCRRFDSKKLSMNPISIELEPLLEIAQQIAKQRNY
jgi:hypothetical protein